MPEKIPTLETLCKIAGEDEVKVKYFHYFLKQALLDEHEAMRQEAIEKLRRERIAGYRVIRSFEADNEVLVLLDLNDSEDPRLTNPQLLSIRSLVEDYENEPVYHFKIQYD